MQEVSPGPPEQVRRLERYRQEHPDVDIQPPGADSAVWRAFRDGNLIAYGFTLMVFLERLETLPEPLGAAQDFGLHLPDLPPGHSPCPAAGSPGPRDGRAGHGWTAGLHALLAHRDTGGWPGAACGSAAAAYQRRHARAVQGGNDRRVGRRDGATCLPPPAGNPVQAGDARGWYYPCAPHTGQAPMPWPARTRWATAICWAAVARFADEAYRPPP